MGVRFVRHAKKAGGAGGVGGAGFGVTPLRFSPQLMPFCPRSHFPHCQPWQPHVEDALKLTHHGTWCK